MPEREQTVCPHCGGTHLCKEITITFQGPYAEAIERMAQRHRESPEQLLWRLLWREAGHLKGVRELMEKE
jgi:hypothetical protein